MNASRPLPTSLPLDPTFSPAAYERVAGLLRAGIVGFLALAGSGMLLQLVLHPTESDSSLLAPGSGTAYPSDPMFVNGLLSLQPSALILLGVFVMVAVTIGRVVLAVVDFYRGRERILAGISAAVVLLLALGLLVVAPLVR